MDLEVRAEEVELVELLSVAELHLRGGPVGGVGQLDVEGLFVNELKGLWVGGGVDPDHLSSRMSGGGKEKGGCTFERANKGLQMKVVAIKEGPKRGQQRGTIEYNKLGIWIDPFYDFKIVCALILKNTLT